MSNMFLRYLLTFVNVRLYNVNLDFKNVFVEINQFKGYFI